MASFFRHDVFLANRCQTAAMSGGTHPFAGAGGGHLFEYKVATLLAADLIRSRHTEHGGVIAAIEMQTGPAGFEDLQVSVELTDGGNRTVHAQCRHRQPFTASNDEFAKLLARAATAISAGPLSFTAGHERLAIIVDSRSPGHVSMTQLCELARDPGDPDRFVRVVGEHGGGVETRWHHCLGAAGGLEAESLHRVLASLEVRAVELESAKSRDSLELINRLADGWTPKDFGRATRLRDALYGLLTEGGPSAGMVDLSFLQSRLSAVLPDTLGAETRRAKLKRRRDGGHRRVVSAIKAIGLNDDEADKLATRVLADPPRAATSEALTVVTGGMGVGKTTELERVHRVAIDRALEDPDAPVPVLFDAREVRDLSLITVVSQRCDGLGDPSRVGVHLIVDALDEAGVQIADLSRRIATLQAEWPNSTVLIGTRPQSEPSSLATVAIEPLTPEAAQSLMTAIHPGIPRLDWFREELSEVLRRPLFAIRYALDHRQGNRTGANSGQLVGSVGRQALRDIGDTTDDAFELLVRLACLVADSGGRLVSLTNLGATPVQVSKLMRSRIIQTTDGRVSFQLAALTEWFAATALLRDPSMLARSVSSPVRAQRWRYVFVQALLQGSADEVDDIMSTLLKRVPATAAWVHHEAQPSDSRDRSTPPASSALEAGARIRRAARAWIEPWPYLINRWTDDGELPTLGVAINDTHLTTAWRSGPDDSFGRVVQLPPGVHPFASTDGSWNLMTSGMPRNGETWPWEWARDEFRRRFDRRFENSELLAEIRLCWPELAWSYAHRMLDRYPGLRSQPVPRADLEARIAEYRGLAGEGEVQIGGGAGDWWLTEGEAFVADLARLDMSGVERPWVPNNAPETARRSRWTTEQLLACLPHFRLVTKTALDVYQALVTRHLPSMAPELNTYQLLPGRIIGLVKSVDPERGLVRSLDFQWHIEPLPKGSQNESLWDVWDSDGWGDDDDWESRWSRVREFRSDLAECMTLYTSFGEPAFSSPTPACSFALELLHGDLDEFEWVSGPARYDPNGCCARPRYT